MKERNEIETSVKKDHFSNKKLSITDFIELHTDFIRDKTLENFIDVIIDPVLQFILDYESKYFCINL